MTPAAGHAGQVDEPFQGPCQATCSCGWEGPLRLSSAEASDDLAGHYRAVTHITPEGG